MAERVKYLGVTMEAATAEVLARLDAERRVPTSGLWLYAVVRAVHGYEMIAQTDDIYVLIWSGLATQKSTTSLKILVGPDTDSETYAVLVASQLGDISVDGPNQKGAPIPEWQLFWDKEEPSIRYIEDTAGTDHLWLIPQWDWEGRSLLITSASNPLITLKYESVVVGGVWRLYGGKKITYPVTDREKLVAILLATMQPKTLALGMNVVFDGKLKPQKSKINFSGTGGQIGEGDVLICHPDDLNRYSPLPGAVALVLGELTNPVEAFTCALPVGDEVLTVVIK